MMALRQVCRCRGVLQGRRVVLKDTVTCSSSSSSSRQFGIRASSVTGGRTRPFCAPNATRALSMYGPSFAPSASLGPRPDDAANGTTELATDGVAYKVHISDTRSNVTLAGPEGSSVSFHSIWLRHNCHCSLCKQEHSGQKTIHPDALLSKYTVTAAYIQGDNLQVSFEEEPDHVTSIPIDFLFRNNYSLETLQEQQTHRQPLVAKGELPTISYTEVLASKEGLLKWLQDLNGYGICLVKDVPTEDGMVKEAVEKVWPVQRTIYGETFDVVSTPSPINVAYSNAELGFHMDLVYYESPPGIQILHCLRYDECVEGGESVFVDSYAVAEKMRLQHPEDFDSLTRIPASFQKIHFERERPVYMKYRRPHIVLTPEGEEDVEPYYRAYRKFAQMLENSSLKLKIRLEPGDLISFNNRRMLHARDSFVLNGGVRHLQGCYLNIDEFKSQLDVLNQLHGDKAPSRRSFNQCFY